MKREYLAAGIIVVTVFAGAWLLGWMLRNP